MDNIAENDILELLGALGSDTLVLTVNKRLGGYLASRYGRYMTGLGRSGWESPLILPLDTWIRSTWVGTLPEKSLLSQTRALALWERVVQDSSPEVLFTGELAAASYKAYELLCDYRAKLPSDDIYHTEESRCLKGWLASYSDELSNIGAIDEPSLSAELCALISGGLVEIPPRIILVGFDEIRPKYAALIDALREAGAGVDLWPGKPGVVSDPKEASVVECTDSSDEVRHAAVWARNELASKKRIGIIVPELERYQSEIMREFSAELGPGSVLPENLLKGETAQVFNLSLGFSLSDIPVVSAALEILSVDLGELPTEDLSALFFSPYLGLARDEREFVAQIDTKLKRDNRYQTRLVDIKGASEKDQASKLASRLSKWLDALAGQKGNKRPSEWAESFSAFLDTVGFTGGDFKPESAEFQALDAWHKLLLDFSTLDDISGSVPRGRALSILKSLASRTKHQPESPDAPVQVLGLLEAAGQSFDAVLLVGADEESIVPEPRPDPFIPFYLQKELEMPGSSIERESAFARALIEGVMRSAPAVTVSYPRTRDDKELRLSRLINPSGTNCAELSDLVSHRYKDSLFESRSLVEIEESTEVPFLEEEIGSISGGVGLLSDQSQCPFRAFAIRRLRAEGIDTPEPGLSGMERGSIVHVLMKDFWEKVRTRAKLEEMEKDGTLEALIEEVAWKAVDAPGVRSSGKWLHHLRLEKKRLSALMREWVAQELAREEFTAESLEEKVEIDVGGLQLTIRIDRIDRLGDSSKVLLDYKTGQTGSVNDWIDPRPPDMQMPVYSLTGEYSAIVYAKVKTGECAFNGLSRGESSIDGVKDFASISEEKRGELSGYDELLGFWRERAERLSKDFLAGESRVDPARLGKSGSACTYCNIRPLCRIGESAAYVEVEEES